MKDKVSEAKRNYEWAQLISYLYVIEILAVAVPIHELKVLIISIFGVLLSQINALARMKSYYKLKN